MRDKLHIYRLTPRQIDILQHMASGLSFKQIAALLGIQARTTRAHASEIYSKLGVDNRWGAVQEGIKRGIIAEHKGLSPVAQVISYLLHIEPKALDELIKAGIIENHE